MTIIGTCSTGESASASSPSAVVACPSSAQLLLITDSDLIFLTPSQGIQVDADSLPKSANNKDSSSAKGKEKEDDAATKTMLLFKTSLVIQRREVYKWSQHTPEMRTGTTTFVDTNWRAAVWSPPNLSSLGGSLLATLTTNRDVAIYEAQKNSHRGEWVKVFDITAALVERYLDEDLSKPETVSRVMQCQATSLAWSPAVERSDLGSPWSILAVGHRSGHITFWAAVTEEDGETSMRLLHRHRIDERAAYITTMCWSPWSLGDEGDQTVVASLAIADSNGKLWCSSVIQDCSVVRPGADVMQSEKEMQGNGLFVDVPLEVGNRDLRHVTQMCWFTQALAGSQEESMVLAYTRLGSVHFAYFTDEPAGDMNDGGTVVAKQVELDLESDKVDDWIGATYLGICCGLEYSPETKSLLVALSSGSFHSISLDPEPAFMRDADDNAMSLSLTATARQHFVHSVVGDRKQQVAKPGKTATEVSDDVSSTQGMRVAGMAEVAGAIGWFFALSTPQSMMYRPKTKATLLVAELFGTVTADEQLNRFAKILESPPSSLYICPSKTLSSFLLFVRNNIDDEDFRDAIVVMLTNPTPPIDLEAAGSITTIRNLTELGIALRELLFGASGGSSTGSILEELRIKETVARFILQLPKLDHDITDVILPLQILLSRKIVHQVVSRLVKILSMVDQTECQLSPDEIAIAAKLFLASENLGAPYFEDLNGVNVSPDSLVMTHEGDEDCPACKQSVPFSNVRHAPCLNHHVWERCSMTLKVISTVNARTCVNCERKVMLAPVPGSDDFLGVVNALVRATPCCLYCGGRWMMVR